MGLVFKKMLGTFLLNSSFFIILLVGIQNSSKQIKLNLIINETVALPVSFIVGISFISGSALGSLFPINSIGKE